MQNVPILNEGSDGLRDHANSLHSKKGRTRQRNSHKRSTSNYSVIELAETTAKVVYRGLKIRVKHIFNMKTKNIISQLF